MKNTKNITSETNSQNADTIASLEPQLPPMEDIIVNLGFWITMAQRAGQMIVQDKFKDVKSDGVSESVQG